MSSGIGKVRAIFTASSSGLVAGVDQSVGALHKLQATAASANRSLGFLAAAKGAEMLGNLTSTIGNYATRMVDMGKSQAEVIDQQSKMADRLGMTHSEMSGLALAGDLAGTSMESIVKAVTKSDVALVKAQAGSKEAQAAFTALGLSVDEMASQSTFNRFKSLTDAVSALPSPAHRAAAAVALFGKTGAELLPLFSEGSGFLGRMVEQSDKLGLSLGTGQRKDVEAMNDAFTMVGKSIGGVITQVVAHLAPSIKEITDQAVAFVGTMGGANIGTRIGEGILEGARYFAAVGDSFIANSSALWDHVSSVGKFLAYTTESAYRVANLFYAGFKFFEVVGNTIGMLIATVVEKLMRAAGDAASLVPGFGSTSESLLRGADAMAATAAQYRADGERNMNTMGNAAVTFFKSDNALTNVGAGPLSTALEAGIARTRANMAEAQAGNAGVAEMMRSSPGVDPGVAKEQLSVLEAIRDALQGPDEQVAVEF
jgi:hypothetical protein